MDSWVFNIPTASVTGTTSCPWKRIQTGFLVSSISRTEMIRPSLSRLPDFFWEQVPKSMWFCSSWRRSAIRRQLPRASIPTTRTLCPYCPNFIAFEVTLPRHVLGLTPWVSWTADKPPLWWTAHNKVKHHRDQHFHEATLKSCLNAVAGLFVCVIHLYEQAVSNGELLQLPRLFNVADHHFGGTKMGRYGNSFK